MKFLLIFILFFSNYCFAIEQKIGPTKYTQCIETMPQGLEKYQSPLCVTQKIQAGADCLNFEEVKFERDLKEKDLVAFNYYQRFKTLQDSGDSQACLRYENGVLKRASSAILKRTKQLRNFIKLTAKYFAVPAEAMACATIGDATVTANIYQSQDSYANNLIQEAPILRALTDLKQNKIDFSKPPSAPGGENPSVEERKSIRNTALILRHGDLLYKKAGFTEKDLSWEILVSIYHLGAYRFNPPVNMGLKMKTEHREPGLSFIGLFCYRYEKEVRSALSE